MKEDYFKELRNQKGITLIALIITIIILVILVAVSINAVTNMGIVGHAINGTQEYTRKAKEENTIMKSTEILIENTIEKLNEIQTGEITYTVTITFQNSITPSSWLSTEVFDGWDENAVSIGSMTGPNGSCTVRTNSDKIMLEMCHDAAGAYGGGTNNTNGGVSFVEETFYPVRYYYSLSGDGSIIINGFDWDD